MNHKLIDIAVNSQEELEAICKQNNLIIYIAYNANIDETREKYKELNFLFKMKARLLCSSLMFNCFINDLNSSEYKEGKITILELVYCYETGEDYNCELQSDGSILYYSKYVDWLTDKFMKCLED